MLFIFHALKVGNENKMKLELDPISINPNRPIAQICQQSTVES